LRSLVTLALLGAAQASRAAAPELSTYAVGSIPVAGGQGDLEFPLTGDFRGQVGLVLLSQGTYQDRNPFSHMSLISPWLWLHYDGVSNLRLSAGFQESWSLAVSAMGLPATREERWMARARLQQPRGAAAIYEMLQFDLRSFDDPTGKHQLVFRPRLRVGTGFNLDATRIHSLVLYQEVALRFADAAYTKRAFDFYRAVVGYTWTTRRGTFITAGVLGQVSLSPAGTRLDLLYGPVLTLAYRIVSAKAAEAPPEPPEIETH